MPPPPPVFRKYLKNGGARTNQQYTLCVNFDLNQVKRSGHQVRSKSDVHAGTGFMLEDRVVGAVLVRMFSNFQDEVWSEYLQNVYFGFFILLTSGQVNFRPGPL